MTNASLYPIILCVGDKLGHKPRTITMLERERKKSMYFCPVIFSFTPLRSKAILFPIKEGHAIICPEPGCPCTRLINQTLAGDWEHSKEDAHCSARTGKNYPSVTRAMGRRLRCGSTLLVFSLSQFPDSWAVVRSRQILRVRWQSGGFGEHRGC